MTREETLQVLAILKTAYPGFYREMSRNEAEQILSLWHDMFAGDDPGLVAAAVKVLIATDVKGFPPHIGAVKEKLLAIKNPGEMTAAEAWGLVYKAVCRGLYSSKEAFAALPPLIREIVGSANQIRDWSVMDADTVQSVVASNFQRAYQARKQQDRDYQLMPPEVKTLVDGIARGLELDAQAGPSL